MPNIFLFFHGMFMLFFKVLIRFFEPLDSVIIFFYVMHHGVSPYENDINQGTMEKGINHNILFAFHILH
jgi:hypothetical protein